MPFFCPRCLSHALHPKPIAAEAPESLKEAYGKNFDVGVAMPSAKLSEAERNLLATHFTAITPENAMKADTIHPKDGKYVFQEADALVDLARQNNLKVERSHPGLAFPVSRLVLYECRESGEARSRAQTNARAHRHRRQANYPLLSMRDLKPKLALESVLSEASR